MITGLVLADQAGEELAATLAALVPAVVEGLIGDAVILARKPDPQVTAMADMAGAALVAFSDGDPWRAGAGLARREWLLCLQAGDVPGEGWMRAADSFLSGAMRRGQPLGRFARRPLEASTIIGSLMERTLGARSARAGDLVQRRWLAREDGRVRPVRIRAVIRRDFA
jgi:hypothetical protein